MALALVFMAMLETVKDFGLGQALVAQSQEDVYERADTVFVSTVTLAWRCRRSSRRYPRWRLASSTSRSSHASCPCWD